MTENHYWKNVDGLFALTMKENDNIGEGWIEITYEEYLQFLNGKEKPNEQS
jgi:hypothetical protein